MKMVKPNDQKILKYLLPAIAVMAVLAVSLVFLFARKEGVAKTNAAYYQYYLDDYKDYGENAKLIAGRYGTVVQVDGEQFESDASPLYHKNEKGLTLPRDFCWLNPKTGTEWKIPAYSELVLQSDGSVICRCDKKEIKLEAGYLYDCRDTFIFLDKVKVTYDAKEIILSPFSFYSRNDFMIRFYNYGSKELTVLSSVTTAVMVSSPDWGYTLNATSGVHTSTDGTQRMTSASPTYLRLITEK